MNKQLHYNAETQELYYNQDHRNADGTWGMTSIVIGKLYDPFCRRWGDAITDAVNAYPGSEEELWKEDHHSVRY